MNEELISRLRSETLDPERPWFIALDRDGTLAPHHADPSRAKLNSATVATLRRLSGMSGVVAAIVSARGVPFLSREFDGCDLVLAGSYGLEIIYPDIEATIDGRAAAARRSLDRAFTRLSDRLDDCAGTILEHHGYTLCVHYHLVSTGCRPRIKELIADVGKDFPDLAVRNLPTSYEIVPPGDWTKADSLSTIALNYKLNDSDRTLTIFAGDSPADEPAFEWANARAGVSIKVGASDNTSAQYCVSTPSDLIEVLECLWRMRGPVA